MTKNQRRHYKDLMKLLETQEQQERELAAKRQRIEAQFQQLQQELGQLPRRVA